MNNDTRCVLVSTLKALLFAILLLAVMESVFVVLYMVFGVAIAIIVSGVAFLGGIALGFYMNDRGVFD